MYPLIRKQELKATYTYSQLKEDRLPLNHTVRESSSESLAREIAENYNFLISHTAPLTFSSNSSQNK